MIKEITCWYCLKILNKYHFESTEAFKCESCNVTYMLSFNEVSTIYIDLKGTTDICYMQIYLSTGKSSMYFTKNYTPRHEVKLSDYYPLYYSIDELNNKLKTYLIFS